MLESGKSCVPIKPHSSFQTAQFGMFMLQFDFAIQLNLSGTVYFSWFKTLKPTVALNGNVRI